MWSPQALGQFAHWSGRSPRQNLNPNALSLLLRPQLWLSRAMGLQMALLPRALAPGHERCLGTCCRPSPGISAPFGCGHCDRGDLVRRQPRVGPEVPVPGGGPGCPLRFKNGHPVPAHGRWGVVAQHVTAGIHSIWARAGVRPGRVSRCEVRMWAEHR